MNRRYFVAAMGTSVATLMAQNRQVLARLQYLSTPAPVEKPEFVSSDFDDAELLYLGTLFTWIALLEDSLTAVSAGLDAMIADLESDEAQVQLLFSLGTWNLIEADTTKVSAPDSFAETHMYAQQVFSHLASAGNILAQGVVAGSATALTLSTEHIYLATESVTSLLETLPFQRPLRTKSFD